MPFLQCVRRYKVIELNPVICERRLRVTLIAARDYRVWYIETTCSSGIVSFAYTLLHNFYVSSLCVRFSSLCASVSSRYALPVCVYTLQVSLLDGPILRKVTRVLLYLNVANRIFKRMALSGDEMKTRKVQIIFQRL
jgi:hypothetical protein